MAMQTILRIAVLTCLIGLGRAHAGQITSLPSLQSGAPLVSTGSPTVWHGSDGSDLEIYFSDGTVTTPLTDNDFDDSFPQFSGTKVVWQGWDGNDWEIFQFDEGITSQLTDNDVDDIAAHFSGGSVQWQSWDGNDWEIFQFDAGNMSQLTDNDVDDRVIFAASHGGESDRGYGSNGEQLAAPADLGPNVPEPSTLALAALGIAALAAWGWRRSKG